MLKVIRKQRKSPVLTPSSIPCLRHLPTINVTRGCSLGCGYCYIRGYPDYPGEDKVVLFENIAELVRAELGRKRRKPARVYFSPSSDAFQDIPEIQEVTYQTMAVLLESGVEIAFLTKGFLSEPFLSLFRSHRRRIFAQIGVTSLDRDLWRIFEPRTAPPDARLEMASKLLDLGCSVTARLDPLIPDVSDSPSSLIPLLRSLRDVGIGYAPASYLFLRSPTADSVIRLLERLEVPGLRPREWRTQRFADGCGGGRSIDANDRKRRFTRLANLGLRYDVTISPCRCKNPTLATTTCQIAGPPRQPGPLLHSEDLFTSLNAGDRPPTLENDGSSRP
ncbi:MAG: radical SAM protein [Phycisphaerae bacterium]|nr:radical SAM protein [Phycisphaerae bacterium]